jgi:hypothetical protein
MLSEIADRLWARVTIAGPDECWPWQERSRLREGYGKMYVAGRVLPAHRIVWTLVNGPVPVGLFVLHRCDNPPCCNPAHLFLGTKADNTHDMIAKGRHRRFHSPEARHNMSLAAFRREARHREERQMVGK